MDVISQPYDLYHLVMSREYIYYIYLKRSFYKYSTNILIRKSHKIEKVLYNSIYCLYLSELKLRYRMLIYHVVLKALYLLVSDHFILCSSLHDYSILLSLHLSQHTSPISLSLIHFLHKDNCLSHSSSNKH